VHSTVALNFHIDPERVSNIYQDVGLQYKERIIDPSMQEAIKGSTAKFTQKNSSPSSEPNSKSMTSSWTSSIS
jgi:hypothetical protein